jgi:uncharacterized protein
MTVSADIQRAAQQAIELVMREIKDIRGAVVSTEDGFEVASQVANTAQVSRLAAVASSMSALGAVAGAESNLGACDSVVIDAAGGHIVMSQVRRGDVDLIFSLVTGKEAVMGQLLYYSREARALLKAA